MEDATARPPPWAPWIGRYVTAKAATEHAWPTVARYARATARTRFGRLIPWYRTVLPGDALGSLTAETAVKVGPGVRRDGAALTAAKTGVVHTKGDTTLWVENVQRRYVPAQEESVIGIVKERLGEVYRVDIGASQPATLPFLAFEGATKRNRPNLAVGTAVYARLSLANKDMEPELVCLTPENRSGGYGELENGLVFKVTLSLARRLLMPDCPVLMALGTHLPFEICVGMNGCVWVNADSVRHTILVANAIQASESVTDKQIAGMVRDLVAALSS